MSQHPEHMAKCYEEIKEVFDNGSGDEYVTQQQINELTHFSLCIKECLRLRSPVPIIGRQLHKDVHIGEQCKALLVTCTFTFSGWVRKI